MNLMANPLPSLIVSAEPFEGPVVENLTNTSVYFPALNTFAFVYRLMSLVTLNFPFAPVPLAWTILSDTEFSLLNSDILLINAKSSNEDDWKLSLTLFVYV